MLSERNGSPCCFLRISIALITTCLLAACAENPQQPQQPQQPQPQPQNTEAKPQEVSGTINTSPLFESAKGWSIGFNKATGHGAGVVVGPGVENANVFLQAFPAAAADQFKIVARASSVGTSTGTGRIQVNWLGPGDKFISPSIKTLDLTSEEKTFEAIMVAPAGAVAGLLYVTPHGPNDVVRYTEMRVLGKK